MKKPATKVVHAYLTTMIPDKHIGGFWGIGTGRIRSPEAAQRALDALWRYTDELFVSDAVDLDTRALGVAIDLDAMRAQWDHMVSDVLARATLSRPTSPARASGGQRAWRGQPDAHASGSGGAVGGLAVVIRVVGPAGL